MKKNEIEMKPEELTALHVEENKQDTIEFKQLIENSLKNIDEIHKLFPHWKREKILKKLKLTHEGKDLRFVAKIDGIIVAHVKIKLGTSIHKHVCSITSLIVNPTHRQKGIGIGLMEYTISKLPKKIKILTLAVDSRNKKAINLYKKLGFEKYGLLEKGSKVNGEFVDNYLMKKDI